MVIKGDNKMVEDNIKLSNLYKLIGSGEYSKETIAEMSESINILEKKREDTIRLADLYKSLRYFNKAYDLYLKIYNESNKKQKRKLLFMKYLSETYGDDFALKLMKKFEFTIIKTWKETICYEHDLFEKDNRMEYLLQLYAKKITDKHEFEYFRDYLDLKGVTEDEITVFEKELNITLPEDIKEYYKFKNGSGNFQLLQTNGNVWKRFSMFPLEIIGYIKKHLAHFDTKFMPFGVSQASGMHSVYLLLDPNTTDGKGQIACHTYTYYGREELTYIASTFSDLLENTKYNLENGAYSKMTQWSLRKWCALPL